MRTRYLGLPLGHLLLGLASACLICLACSCTPERQRIRKSKPFPTHVNKVVVVGFHSAVEQGTSPDVIRSPISGSALTAEEVPSEKIRKMTHLLFKRFSSSQRYDLVSPSQARGVYSTIMDSKTTTDEMEIIKKIGRAFSADGVLTGYLYRWHERQGSEYAVRKAASVAYDLYLVRPSDGRVLWKGGFDMTQKSLSENLLEMDTFIQGGGKWMTADELAELGLNRLLSDLNTENIKD